MVLGGASATFVRITATENQSNGIDFSSSSGEIADSLAAGNDSYGVVVLGTSDVMLSEAVLTENGIGGLDVNGASPVARIAALTVTGNGIGLRQEAGTLESFGDNLVRGNTTNASGTISAVGKT